MLRNEAVKLYNEETINRTKKQQSLQKEAELRKQLSRKKTYISKYSWKEPPQI